MWPVVLGKVVAGAALVIGGLVVWQKYQQEQERQQVYWEPFQASVQPDDSASVETWEKPGCSCSDTICYLLLYRPTATLSVQHQGAAFGNCACKTVGHYEDAARQGAQVCHEAFSTAPEKQ